MDIVALILAMIGSALVAGTALTAEVVEEQLHSVVDSRGQ